MDCIGISLFCILKRRIRDIRIHFRMIRGVLCTVLAQSHNLRLCFLCVLVNVWVYGCHLEGGWS